MGYFALAIRDVIHATDGSQRSSRGEFLGDHPVSGSSKLYDDLSDEIAEVYMTDISPEEQVWQLFFNDTSRTGPRGNIIVGVGVVLVSPYNYVIPSAFLLTEPCSNNVAEYNALLKGM